MSKPTIEPHYDTRPVIATINVGGQDYRMAIQAIDHPAFFHSLFWFSNELLMRTWGNTREILEGIQSQFCRRAPMVFPASGHEQQDATVTVSDGSRYATVAVSVSSHDTIATGYLQVLCTILSVTGGSFIQVIPDMLEVFERYGRGRLSDNVNHALLPDASRYDYSARNLLNQMLDGMGDDYASTLMTPEEHKGCPNVQLYRGHFHVPTLTMLYDMYIHVLSKQYGSEVSADDLCRKYVEDTLAQATECGFGLLCALYAGGRYAAIRYSTESGLTLTKGPLCDGGGTEPPTSLTLPHPTHGYNLTAIVLEHLA